EDSELVVMDSPPANERFLSRLVERGDVAVVPTRVGGIEAPRVETVLGLVPDRLPAGLVICSARTFTRGYHETLATWSEAKVPVWGTVPERVAIAAGPTGPLTEEGLEAYRKIWRRVQTAARSR